MANFTQLHLDNNRQDAKKKQPDQQRKELSREKALFVAGLLAITVMSGVFLVISNGCSKGSKTTSGTIEPPISNPIATSPAPVPVVAAVQPPVVTPKPAKKRVQRTAPMTSYSEPNYGLSFRYPKNYLLKSNSESKLDLAGLGPVQSNFVQPGAVAVASLELPRASYPGTDFSSGFFTVSVNSAISKDQCEQFAFPNSKHSENEPGSVSKVKIAGNEYSMIEDFGDSTGNEPHLKYFHRFENGNCYEFSMGLGTTDNNLAGLKPVNRSLVFGKLEQILASVKLQPVVVPEVAKDAPAHPLVEGSKQ